MSFGIRWRSPMRPDDYEPGGVLLKDTHLLPVAALVRTTFYRMDELFVRKATDADHWIRNGCSFSEFATKQVEENLRYVGNIIVNRFDQRNEVFEVREMSKGSKFTVNPYERGLLCLNP
ncbi:hypothetical protein PIB30_092241 [Stylosanthes scabra]|uniref:Uncharacterized protein n=1 Tax=Stylosanthes scabra TaxID=79078 RepID=A0ABU6RV83_9FABA|nr:hypothetical protein [Stylosanthes scabra]